jgi:hypothetical protein
MAGRSQHLEQIMENQTCFDLNAAMENWRQELAAQAGLTVEVRRELETHLRDAIAGFQQRGLNDEESFWLARRRVGQPQLLGEEFVKADPAAVWRERVFWMAAGVLAALFLFATTTPLITIIGYCFPSVGKIVGEPTLHLMLWVLQMYGITFLIARGNMNLQSSLLASFIKDRFRFAIMTISVLLIAKTFCATIMLWAYVASRNVYFNGGPFAFVGNYVFVSLVEELVPVAILIWLLPTQNRKTPKRA